MSFFIYYYWFDKPGDKHILVLSTRVTCWSSQDQYEAFLKFKKLVYDDRIDKSKDHEFDPITEKQNRFLISKNLLIKNRGIYTSGNNWIKGQSKNYYL